MGDIVWSEAALTDLDAIADYGALDNRAVAVCCNAASRAGYAEGFSLHTPGPR